MTPNEKLIPNARSALIIGSLALATSFAPASAEIYDPDLVEAARSESGTITYYFISGAEANRPLFDAFSAEFDFLDFEVAGGDPLSLIEKVLNENALGRPIADILQGGPMEDAIINTQNGLGGLTRPSGEQDVPEEFKFPGDYIVPDYFSFHIAYNTNLVEADAAPLTLEDLTTPEWTGRFGIDVQQMDWFAGMLAYYGEERGIEIFEALAANEPMLVAGAQGYEQMAAGALPVIANASSSRLVDYIDRGAPIEISVSPFVIAQPDIYIGIEQSENPASVALFFEFLFTPEAQEILSQQVYKNPVLPGVEQPPHLEAVLAPEVEKFFVTSQNFGDFDERTELFQSLFVQ